MEKRNNKYKILVEEIELKDGSSTGKNLQVEIVNHDDLFQIIEMAKSKNIFPDEKQATEFALGLKLFTEVVLRNTENPLFDDLKPAIGAFMQKLKRA
ncbi:DUF3861 domain-containing protein [Flavobacterium sp. RHBU_3]|uniref:DUF3861 domain-containing protein n=1 Tax=Flavobacterium sp. RHBU_3 TaxID=3391184 RepID=UPI003984A122